MVLRVPFVWFVVCASCNDSIVFKYLLGFSFLVCVSFKESSVFRFLVYKESSVMKFVILCTLYEICDFVWTS